MSSIPLPALDLKPPQPQPGPMEMYGNLMRLKAMQEQVAEAPLRQQALQNQVQAGGLQVQQQQQALMDQKAMTPAMQQWDGKDMNALALLILKNGGSGMAVMSLKQKQLAMQQQYSQIAKNDADAGTANLKAMQIKGDLISGALSPLVDPKQTPDDALPQAITATAQDLIQRGLLDPQQAQAAQPLAQSGNPQQMRTQLDLMRKSFMGQSQLMDAALKQAQTGSATAAAAKNQAESDYYKQNGGAPGVSAPLLEMHSWLQSHPGSTPSDYQQHVLAMQAAMRPEFPRIVPVNDAKGNVIGYNTFTSSGAGTKAQFLPNSQINGLPQATGSPNGYIPPKPTASVLTQSQRAQMIQPQVDALNSQIDATTKYLGPLAGRWSGVMAGKVGANSPQVAKLQTQLKLYTTALMLAHGLKGEEYEKSLGQYFNTAQSPENLKARIAGANGFLEDYANSTGHGPGSGVLPNAQGGGNGFSVKAPNGKTYSFKDQASADAFKKNAGIQ